MWWVQTLWDARKRADKLYLSAIFSSGYKKTAGFLGWQGCSAVCWCDYETAVKGFKDTVRLRERYPCYLKTFSHTGISGACVTCNKLTLEYLTKHLQRFQSRQKRDKKKSWKDIKERKNKSLFPQFSCSVKCWIAKMAENAQVYRHHVMKWLSACCFCRILWVPVKEMTPWYEPQTHSWSSAIAHMATEGSRSSFLDSSSFLCFTLPSLKCPPGCTSSTFSYMENYTNSQCKKCVLTTCV